MKQTALSKIHEASGARMVSFAGYQMPVVYSSINEEHLQVRKAAGLFDVSHMGEFLVKGPEAARLVQHVTTNDVYKLFPGKAQYSCMTNEKGGIVDDLLVYMTAEDEYMLVVNASNIDKDWEWINRHNHTGAILENISDDTSLFAVQGPLASSVLQPLTEIDLPDMKYYTFETGRLASVKEALISATGYTGAGGFEVYLPNRYAKEVWEAILEAGKEAGIMPIGLGARDTLRLEKGFCLYGNDINDDTSPLEAGLSWITKLKAKDNDFVARDILVRQKEEGVKRRLTGFEMIEKGIPRQHYRILDAGGNPIGEVTSGTFAPSLNKAIGMGYVTSEMNEEGNEIYIEIRKKRVKAIISKPPFK